MKFDVVIDDPRVYIIVADMSASPLLATKRRSLFKVGLTRNVSARLTQLQTGSPFPLRVLADDMHTSAPIHDLKRKIHERLSHLALSGEWFFGDPHEAYLAYEAISNEEADRAWFDYARASSRT